MKLPKRAELDKIIDQFNSEYHCKRKELMVSDEKFDTNEGLSGLDKFKKMKGVYVILNKKNHIIRIGSTLDDLHKRLKKYFYEDEDDDSIVKGWGKEGVSGKFVYVIEVDVDRDHEIPALERLLLMKLEPPLNKEGKKNNLKYREDVLPELKKMVNVSRSWYI